MIIPPNSYPQSSSSVVGSSSSIAPHAKNYSTSNDNSVSFGSSINSAYTQQSLYLPPPNSYSLDGINFVPYSQQSQYYEPPSSSYSNPTGSVRDDRSIVLTPMHNDSNQSSQCWWNDNDYGATMPVEVQDHVSHNVDVYKNNTLLPLPCYNDESVSYEHLWNQLDNRLGSSSASPTIEIREGGEGEPAVKAKGTHWTEDEHKLFLYGLKTYGKGDWRSISRNLVTTRSPTQVASHAQKFFSRRESMRTKRKRSSIHDITNVDDNYIRDLVQKNLLSAGEASALENHSMQLVTYTPQHYEQRVLSIPSQTHSGQPYGQEVNSHQLQTHTPQYIEQKDINNTVQGQFL